jgi:hypothetical protein
MADVADYLYYFMDTNDWGSPARLNGTVFAGANGTFNGDIAVGVYEYVRWDGTNLFLTPPPPLPSGKNGYDWFFETDSVVGFDYHRAEVDSGRPDIVSFSYWNLTAALDSVHVPVIDEWVYFHDWEAPIPGITEPVEDWNNLDGSEGIGHAVTGVGYYVGLDPDGAGPLPSADWIVCHDNIASTEKNVAVPFDPAVWKQTVRVAPGWQLIHYPGVYCPSVPDVDQPPAGSWSCATANYCAPVSAVNITGYWDSVVGYSNAVGVNAGFSPDTVADYLGYFMATNGNATANCGHTSRLNASGSGTYTTDIAPGLLDYVCWDSGHQLPPAPPPGLPASKTGYTWSTALDTTGGFAAYTAEIDKCLPPVVVFNYWNPQYAGLWFLDTASQDTMHLYHQGPPVANAQANSQEAPEEAWPCVLNPDSCDRATLRGHAVTGVGYAAAFDPDGTGPIASADWIICHDNWQSTRRNVMIEWTAWNATIAVDPTLPVHTTRCHCDRLRPLRAAVHSTPRGLVVVFASATPGTVRATLCDVAGRTVKELCARSSDSRILIPVHAVPPGVYSLRLSAPSGTRVNTVAVVR